MNSRTLLLFIGVLAIVIALATSPAHAQDDPEGEMMGEPPTHQTEYVDDDADIPQEGGGPLSEEHEQGGLGGEVNVVLPKECDENPHSEECVAEKDRLAEPERRLKEEESQMKQFDEVVHRLETLTNVWCCAASGIPLFEVRGDRDVFSYGWHLLAQSFLDAGQTYGSQLVTQFHRQRSIPMYSCDGIQHGDASEYEGLSTALLEMKELLVKWLSTNEVEAGEIISNFFNNFRGTYGNWGVVRLLLQSKSEENDSVPEDAVFGVIPLLKTSDSESEELCFVGGQLYTMYKRVENSKNPASAKMQELISELLDGCFTNGRIANKPHNFGEILLSSDRESQARELFDIATQRGVLCHPLQRPDNEQGHHKALSASPFWTLEEFPSEVRTPLSELAVKMNHEIEKFPFSNDHAVMADFLNEESTAAGGKWERTTIYGNNQWNRTLVAADAISNETLNHIKDMLDVLIDSNDGYAFGCNGSVVVELWRMWPSSETRRSNGATNIVLQLLAPLSSGSGHSLMVVGGDESMVLEEGEIGILDDTFENVLKVEASDEGSASEPMVLLHVQLCHPEMHEKAMSLNMRRCPKRNNRS